MRVASGRVRVVQATFRAILTIVGCGPVAGFFSHELIFHAQSRAARAATELKGLLLFTPISLASIRPVSKVMDG